MSINGTLAARAAELREVFDRERAEPIATGIDEQVESLLAIRVSRDAYAIRVSEITGLMARKKIAALPTPMPALLGLAGVRGTLVPVYSLAILLGHRLDDGQSKWLALCGASDCQALAFDELEGYVRVLHEQVHAANREAARSYVIHVAKVHSTIRAIVSIPLLQRAIQEHCAGSAAKER